MAMLLVYMLDSRVEPVEEEVNGSSVVHVAILCLVEDIARGR